MAETKTVKLTSESEFSEEFGHRLIVKIESTGEIIAKINCVDLLGETYFQVAPKNFFDHDKSVNLADFSSVFFSRSKKSIA